MGPFPARLRTGWIFATGILLLAVLLANLPVVSWRNLSRYFAADPLAQFPRVTLWVWERPEDLEFINPREVGLAVLAKTIVLEGKDLIVFPRRQPARFPPDCTMFAVVRIETRLSAGPTLMERQRQEAVRQIAELASSREVSGIQIDFDAAASERSFYRQLLIELRDKLPSGIKLSITALASWCVYDDWISGLPVDEAVPMLFRMGKEDKEVKRYLDTGRDFRAGPCRYSLGISTDELPSRFPHGRRVYIFTERPWSEESYKAALKYAKEGE